MRRIYLHIGCGKTGSSALQVWFSQIAEYFKSIGIYYPQDNKVSSDYEITSGNAVSVVRAIQAGCAREYFETLIAENPEGDLLLSSEMFQLLSLDQLSELCSIFEDHKLNPIVIAYVRDVYDFANSAHGQMVKRHGCTSSFREFVFDQSWKPLIGQHLDVIERFESQFNDIRVVHYDAEKSRLGAAFLDVIGKTADQVPSMSSATVNRSLSMFELELMRHLNKLYISRFGNEGVAKFSTSVSDALIYANPEQKAEFYFDPHACAQLEDVFGERVLRFNSRYFKNGGGLRIIDEGKKKENAKQGGIENAYLFALRTLFDMVESIRVGENQTKNCKLSIDDPRMVDALRDEAIRIERSDLLRAFTLMSAAKELRPYGPVINQKLEQYTELLKLPGNGG